MNSFPLFSLSLSPPDGEHKGNRSVLRYPGGKGRCVGIINRILDGHNIHGGLFAEPFAGGAAVGLAMLETGRFQRLALNDVDPLIYALWTCIFSPTDARWLANEVLGLTVSLDMWQEMQDSSPSDIRGMARKCLILNRTSFNGILSNSGPLGGWKQDKRTLGERFNQPAIAARILTLSRFSAQVTVHNEDWQTFCNHTASPDRFLYLDPPYYYRAERLYSHIFNDAQHETLRHYLLNEQMPWLLSYDDADAIRCLYKDIPDYFVIEKDYSTHAERESNHSGREVLYSNLNTGTVNMSALHGVAVKCRSVSIRT